MFAEEVMRYVEEAIERRLRRAGVTESGIRGVAIRGPLSGAVGFANPMTTLGDLIVGASGGAADRLGVGSDGDVLTLVSGEPAWDALPVPAQSRLDEVTVGAGGAASVTFSSIPGTHRHLTIRYTAHGDDSIARAIEMRFNGDTAGNYDWQYVNGSSTTPAAATGSAQTSARCGSVSGSGAPAGSFATGVINIQDYTNTVAMKGLAAHGGRRDTATVFTSETTTGWWRTTNAAITSITLFPTAGSFVEHSRFTLYGHL